MAYVSNPRPYPFAALERVPREVVGYLAGVRRALDGALLLDAKRVADALAAIVRTRVEVIVGTAHVIADDKPLPGGVSVALGTADGTVEIALHVETELAHGLIARMLGRPRKIADPLKTPPPAVEGAMLAVATAVARRAHGEVGALVPLGRGGLRFAPGERRLLVQVTLLIDDEAFTLHAVVRVAPLRLTGGTASSRHALASLGDVAITMPVVAAVSAISHEELAAVAPGDAYLPGTGWTVRREGRALTGEVSLVSPPHDQGIVCTLGADGSLHALAVKPVLLDFPAADRPRQDEDQAAGAHGAFEATVVVRVELGAVTMSAREWASLRVGDAIKSQPLDGPVILRCAGVEVARGELVEIEGELAVRIPD